MSLASKFTLRGLLIIVAALTLSLSSRLARADTESRWGNVDIIDANLNDDEIPDNFDFANSDFKEVEFQPFSYHKKYMRLANDDDDAPFSYDPKNKYGPRSWGNFYPQCGGSRQSPINIVLSTCENGTRTGPLRVSQMNMRPEEVTMENNGHSIEFSFEYEDERPVLSGGPLKSQYVFEQLHFHWSNRNNEGSEHRINNRAAAMEMHLVHRNMKYRNSTVAAQYRDGLVVVGLLFEVSSGAQPAPFLKNLDQLRRVQSSVTIRGRPRGFRLKDILGSLHQPFVAYQGSLTTPPCSEAVSWMVARHPYKISPSDMLQFRKIFTYDNKFMAPNYRPIQARNDRFCLNFH